MDITTRRIELPSGVSLYVREKGHGSPTTLLLHGWAVSGAVWDTIVDRWPADAGRLIVPDLRGTGWSSKPREGYTLDDDTRDVVALIDSLGLTDLILVGHSKGGTIAQRVALERPAALRQLVLVCPVPASGMALPPEGVAGLRSLCGHREGSTQLILSMTKKDIPAALLTPLVESMASVALESLYGGLDAFRGANFAERLGGITTPTVVLGGAAEHVITPAILEEFVVAAIPGARYSLFVGTGHYPQLECPDELVHALTHGLRTQAVGNTVS